MCAPAAYEGVPEMIIDHAHYQDGRRHDTGSGQPSTRDGGYGLSSREQRELQSVIGEHRLLALDRRFGVAGSRADRARGRVQIIQPDLGGPYGVRTVAKILKRCDDSPERWARAVSTGLRLDRLDPAP
jgi:hypothetical protein